MARRRHGEIATLPASVAHFFELMLDHAPAPAIGYQLLFDDGRHLYRYPSARRSWIPADGQPCNRSAFRLYPFEIPIVPRRSLYAVQLVTRFYRLLTPNALLQGVWLDPVRPCLVEEGDLIA